MIVLHFILSLFFVGLFTALFVVLYFYIVKFAVWLYRAVTKSPSPKPMLRSLLVKKVFLAFLVINTAVFLQQFIYWNGKGSAYHSAKCYYAAGNVIAMYRSFLAPVLSPNNPLTYWLELPQKVIFDAASPLIPQEDGELALWRYHWFAYPFAKRFTMPHRIWESDDRFWLRSKGEIATIVWEYIKAVNNDCFKDQKMRDEHALRDLPLAALYLDEMYNHEKVPQTIFVTTDAEEAIAAKPIEYDAWQLKMITGPYDTEELHAKYKRAFDRNWMVWQKARYIASTAYEALNALETKWKTSENMQGEGTQSIVLEATRKAAMIAMLQRGAFARELDASRLSCSHPYVMHYIKLRKELLSMAKRHSGQPLINNVAKRIVERSVGGKRFKYIFEGYCGYTLAGGYDIRFGSGTSSFKEDPVVVRYRDINKTNESAN